MPSLPLKPLPLFFILGFWLLMMTFIVQRSTRTLLGQKRERTKCAVIRKWAKLKAKEKTEKEQRLGWS